MENDRQKTNKILFAGTDVIILLLFQKIVLIGISLIEKLKEITCLMKKSSKWMNDNNGIYVEECVVNEFGDLVIKFSNRNVLEVMVETTDDTECRRVFEVGFKNEQ